MLRLLVPALFFFIFESCIEAKHNQEDQNANHKPNFLIIIADDAGWNDLGFHNSEIRTPALDSLTAGGLILDRFYTFPTCSPARASLLTGRPASRMGIVAPISGKSELKLPDSILTLPQALKKQNYKTALLGKWHLGLKPENGPEAYGFDYSYGFLHGQLDQYAHTYKNGDSTWHKNGRFITEKGHVTDLLTKAAVTYLKEQTLERSFYLQIAYSAPHIPLQEPSLWLNKYDSIQDPSRRAYAAAMSHMDAGISEILRTLKQKGLRENTVILFMSDNGAQENWIPTEQYEGKYGPNLTLGDNYPLRDYKTSNYEGAIRVPAIISWPNVIGKGTCPNYLTVADIMPTLLQWAGMEAESASIEGIDVQNLLNTKFQNRKSPIYIRGHLQESILVQPYKLIRTRNHNSKASYELYNLEKDPSEKVDLSQTETKILQDLKESLENEFASDPKTVNKELPLKYD